MPSGGADLLRYPYGVPGVLKHADPLEDMLTSPHTCDRRSDAIRLPTCGGYEHSCGAASMGLANSRSMNAVGKQAGSPWTRLTLVGRSFGY